MQKCLGFDFQKKMFRRFEARLYIFELIVTSKTININLFFVFQKTKKKIFFFNKKTTRMDFYVLLR